MSILHWNIYGLGNNNSESHLRHLIHFWKLKIIVIAEPKISGNRANQVCKRLGFDGVYCQEAMGMKGGIWILWH